MKAKFTLLALIQVFFLVVIGFLMIETSTGIHDLQPVNADAMTKTGVELSEAESIEGLKAFGKKAGLNVAVYDEENNNYYIYFTHTINPKTVYGVPIDRFIADSFSENNCASTDVTKKCDITLSKPDKKQQISVFPIEKMPKKDNIMNFEVYHNTTQTREQIQALVAAKDANASIQSGGGIMGDSFIEVYVFFIIIDILLLLSIIQSMYKQGKKAGVQSMFGRSFFERAIGPLLLMLGTVSFVFGGIYALLYHYVTFDWAYLMPVALYCLGASILFAIGLTYHQLHIHTRPINSLIKGLLASKVLMAGYIMMSILFLVGSGIMIPTVSAMITHRAGQYNILAHYEKELQQAGIMYLKNTLVERAFSGDEETLDKNNQLMEHLSPYLEKKKENSMFYYNDKSASYAEQHEMDPVMGQNAPIFQVFYVNKNFVLRKLGAGFNNIDFADNSKVYVFMKKNAAQQKERAALQYSPELNRKFNFTTDEVTEREIQIISYEGPEIDEYVATYRSWDDRIHNKLEYKKIADPIYVVEGGNEIFNEFRNPTLLDGKNGSGYYMSLASGEARKLWASVPAFLQEIGATEYYETPSSLWQEVSESVLNTLTMIYVAGVLTVICFIGSIILLYTFLEAYFRNNRKHLVMKKIFGSSFLQRYWIIFTLISVSFALAWGYQTYMSGEWKLFNVLISLSAIVMMNLALWTQISRLEKAAINIVIKE